MSASRRYRRNLRVAAEVDLLLHTQTKHDPCAADRTAASDTADSPPDDGNTTRRLRNPLLTPALKEELGEGAASDKPPRSNEPLRSNPAPQSDDTAAVGSPNTLRTLADEIRRLEGGFGNPRQRHHIPTGMDALDCQLPGRGIASGALHELSAPCAGAGMEMLSLWLAARASTEGGYVLWLDDTGEFYPPAAWAWGIDPHRLVVVRAADRRQRLFAMDQALRCAGVAAVIGAVDQIDFTGLRRLQLAAEHGGGIGLLLRWGRRADAAPGATSRWLVEPAPSVNGLQRFTVTVSRCRGGKPLRPVVIEADRESHLVALPAELAGGSDSSAVAGGATQVARCVV